MYINSFEFCALFATGLIKSNYQEYEKWGGGEKKKKKKRKKETKKDTRSKFKWKK